MGFSRAGAVTPSAMRRWREDVTQEAYKSTVRSNIRWACRGFRAREYRGSLMRYLVAKPMLHPARAWRCVSMQVGVLVRQF